VFFFQAEDGIRDDLVTGVQTCALPIWIRTLKRAQDLLGRLHDLEVLIARTRGIQSSPGASTLKVSADLDRLVRRLETECRQLHGHYMAMRPALLQLCQRLMAARARTPRDPG